MKNQALLMSDWAVIASPVTVQSSMYFFVTDGRVATPANPAQRVTAGYSAGAGQWYMTDVNVAMGTPIVATGMRVSPTVPRRRWFPARRQRRRLRPPRRCSRMWTLDTCWWNVVQNTGNSDVTAVLMNNKGDLETRDARGNARNKSVLI